MPTEMRRVTIAVPAGTMSEIDGYRYREKIKNQTQAVLSLIELGLDACCAPKEDLSSLSAAAMQMALDYDSLDLHGQRLLRELTALEQERVQEQWGQRFSRPLAARGYKGESLDPREVRPFFAEEAKPSENEF